MLHGWVKTPIQGKEICTFSLPAADVYEIGVVFLAQKAATALPVHFMIAIKVARHKWAIIPEKCGFRL